MYSIQLSTTILDALRAKVLSRNRNENLSDSY